MIRDKFYLIAVFIASFFVFHIQALNIEPVQESEEHEVTVSLKLVQVYVTDKKGDPVIDLEKNDFEVYEKGKIREITDFERHVLSAPVVQTDAAKKKLKQTKSPKLNRKFILFFDFAFNTSRGILDSKEAALHFIDEYLQPTDEVGLVSFSSSEGFVLHEVLSTDHQKIREVVDSFGIKRIVGRAEDLEKKYWRHVVELDEMKQTGADPFVMGMKEQEKEILGAARIEFQLQISIFIKTVKAMAKALRYYPGHKHIIMFSSGIPRVVFEGAPVNTTEVRERPRFEAGTFGNWKLRTDYENMTKELASSNCAVHTVYSIGRISGINEDIETEYASKDSNQIDGQLSGKAPLEWISEASGGKHFGNIKNYDTFMKELQNYTSSYYILGYYVNEKKDGKYHKLKVKVKRKGCKVFAQEGYFNPKPFSKYSKLEKQWHFLELVLIEKPKFQTPLVFSSIVLPCVVNGLPICLLILKMPKEQMGEISGNKVEIVNIIFNEHNDIVDFRRTVINLSLSQKKNMTNYCLSYLPPGKYRSRVVIRNMETGRAAVANSPVVIPQAADTGLRLYPPLLLIPEDHPQYINSKGIKENEGEKHYSSLTELYPFDASQYSPLVRELHRGVSELLVLTRGSALDIQDGVVKFYARLVYEPTWKDVPLKLNSENKAGVFSLKIPADNLLPGRYYLYLFAEEPNSQAKANVNTTFMVK